MRTVATIICFLSLANALGQACCSFQLDLQTNDSIIRVIWADVNNDSLLDVVVGHKSQSKFKVSAFVNGKTEPWPLNPMLETAFVEGISFSLGDVNKDAKIDVLVWNEVAVLVQYYLNRGNFSFVRNAGWGSTEVFIKALQMADINNDGVAEDIWTEGASIEILNRKYLTTNDTSLLRIVSFKSVDFDRNGFNDLVFSGIDNAFQPITFIWLFGDDFKILNRFKVADIAGQLDAGDLNHDGLFDLVVAGKDANGNLTTQLFLNTKTSFAHTSFTTGLDSASIRIADFTSDGLADVALFGKMADGKTANWIRTFTGDSIPLSANIEAQDFGDYDRDGDLDWAQTSGSSIVVYYNNLGPENKGPGKATKAIGLQVRDRMFFYWDKPLDDHTSSNSITYDLRVFNVDTTIIEAEFDNVNRHRLLVSHGNIGPANFALQKIQGNYNFEIQSVDNAFVPEVKSICSGVCSTCATMDEQNITVCGSSSAILTAAAPQAMWFSFSKGFLGISDTYNFEGAKADTIFSFNPSGNVSCASLRLFNIKANPSDTVRISHTRYACQEQSITLEISQEWKSVSWKNNLNSTVAARQSLIHTLAKEIIFTAFASNNFGCQLKEQFSLKLSKPNLQLNGTQFQIMKGGSVQLSATGGDSYQWLPASSLNNNEIANPVATPEETTEYKVVALDSLRCSAEGKVLVEVSEEAFIPTLFTPNGDQRNDNLKIYGLTQASNFRFVIYNRDGNMLFESNDVTEVTSTGWTGAVNGTSQPPGTYYWKVEGRLPKGDLLLNGKRKGAFLLVR